MSNPTIRSSPGMIAGIILFIVAILAGVFILVLIIHRRRAAASVPIFQSASADLEKSFRPDSMRHSTPKNRRKLRRKAPPMLPADLHDEDIFSPDFILNRGADANSRNHSLSTLSVNLSPSFPRVFKVKTEGGGSVGVEVRVTPPTPNAAVGGGEAPRRSEFSMRRLIFGNFGGVPVTQSVADSKWWSL